MKRVTACLLAISVFLTALVPMTLAGDGGGWDYAVDISSKFGRGLTNIITSPAEIPCNVANEMDDMGPYKGFFPGLGLGVFKMGRRMFDGVLDIGTFIIPSNTEEMPYVCQGRKEKPLKSEDSY
jgi:putative exosortase-associated protein (TIGR04073 family)